MIGKILFAVGLIALIVMFIICLVGLLLDLPAPKYPDLPLVFCIEIACGILMVTGGYLEGRLSIKRVRKDLRENSSRHSRLDYILSLPPEEQRMFASRALDGFMTTCPLPENEEYC
jgi:hypothetical protein